MIGGAGDADVQRAPVAAATRSPGSGRLVAARVLAGVSVFLWVGVFFGLVDVVVIVDRTPGFHAGYLQDTGWGVLYTFLVGGAFLALAVRPTWVMPVVQLGVVTVALAVTAVAAGSWWHLVPAGAIGVTCVALAALAGSPPPRPSVPRLDPAVATVAAVLAVPAVWAAAAVCLGFRQDTLGVSDNTWNLDHWPTQAALALAVPGVALAIAAGVRARWSGTWVAAVCVAVTAVWFGVSSAAYPDLSGSGGRWGGIGLVVWAVVLVVVVILRARRTAGSVGGRRPGL